MLRIRVGGASAQTHPPTAQTLVGSTNTTTLNVSLRRLSVVLVRTPQQHSEVVVGSRGGVAPNLSYGSIVEGR